MIAPLATKKTDLSVVVGVPCHNNSWQLQGLLESVHFQTRQVDEIVLVDDNSTQEEFHKIRHIAADYGAKFIPLPPPANELERTGRRSHARNAIVLNSKSELILFLDGDMLLSPTYIDDIAFYHALDGMAMVRGQRFEITEDLQAAGMASCLAVAKAGKPLTSERPLHYFSARMKATHYSGFSSLLALPLILYNHGESINRRWFLKFLVAAIPTTVLAGMLSSRGLDGDRIFSMCYSDRWDWCASNNLSLRRKSVERIGGWDEQFFGWGEEDIDFAYRLFRSGLRPIIPSAHYSIAYHINHYIDIDSNRKSMRRNALHLLQKHPELTYFRRPIYQSYNLNV